MKQFAQIFLFVIPGLLFAQQAVFEAYSNAKEVMLNSYFEVSFTLKNANGTDFSPPDFKDFIILSGPSTSSSMQIINGVVSREMGFSYTLQPVRVGKFTIGSASVKAGGRVLRSKPLSIEVVQGKSATSSGKAEEVPVFIKLELSKKTAYPGEQILLEYKLYTTVSVEGFDVMVEPDYKGFFAMELKRYDSRSQREIIGGKDYTTKVLRSITLFPQQTGTLSISPATIQLAVTDENDPGGFFFSRSVKPVMITTEELKIEVLPLPNDAPESFNGAVGSFDFSASINRNVATTDDAISLVLNISGNGDMKRVQAPVLMLSDSFEVYPAKVVDEQTSENQGEILGTKVLEYLIVPKLPGNYQLSPQFSYFDTEAKTYKTIQQGPFELDVAMGSDRHYTADNSQPGVSTEKDIRFIKLHADLSKKDKNFTGSAVFWGLAAAPALMFLGLFFYRKKLEQDKNADPLLLKMRKANKEARRRLSLAQTHLKEGKSRMFYDEVSKASLGYICDKLHIPLSELTKENVQERLRSLEVSQAMSNDFMQVIQRCEMALFAGLDNAESMDDTYQKAIEVIAGIEKEIGKN